jgi:hypothetical protein
VNGPPEIVSLLARPAACLPREVLLLGLRRNLGGMLLGVLHRLLQRFLEVLHFQVAHVQVGEEDVGAFVLVVLRPLVRADQRGVGVGVSVQRDVDVVQLALKRLGLLVVLRRRPVAEGADQDLGVLAGLDQGGQVGGEPPDARPRAVDFRRVSGYTFSPVLEDGEPPPKARSRGARKSWPRKW